MKGNGVVLSLLLWPIVVMAQWTEPEPFDLPTGTAVRGPWTSNDNLRVYAAFTGYIFFTERDSVGAPWQSWRSVAAHINSGTRQESPCESPSGDTLYFMSWERPEGSYGDYDIYYCVRTDTGWGPVINCGANINSEYMEWSVGISRDGETLLVCSWRPTGYGDNDVYYSEKQPDGTWGPLVDFGPNVNASSPRSEEHACLSPDNSRLFFSRSGSNMGDIWCSNWVNGVWQLAVALPSPVNTSEREFDPCIAADGRTLFFIRQYPQTGNILYTSIDTTATAIRSRGPVALGVSMEVYPNPVTSTLYLSVSHGPFSGTFSLFNILGQCVFSAPYSHLNGVHSIRLPDALPSGTYFGTFVPMGQYRMFLSKTYPVIILK